MVMLRFPFPHFFFKGREGEGGGEGMWEGIAKGIFKIGEGLAVIWSC